MKKLIMLSMLLIAGITLGLTSCVPKSKKQESEKKEAVTVVKGELTVENAVSTDRYYMYLHYPNNYRWYETCVVMKDFLDEDSDGTIEQVSSVFQVITPDTKGGADTDVVFITHSKKENTIDVKHGFWIEDFELNEKQLPITFKQAFDIVQSTNYPKPHSRYCVLRKQVGPVLANPQYIFGNRTAQLYVDAITGNISDKNPVFEGSGVAQPLGEWP